MQAITPELLLLIDTIARHGSFAKAARELDKVPSAITYAIRKLEDSLDVLLFDRSGHRAQLTPAGDILLRDGRPILQSLDGLARRVKRVASGWEQELRIAVSAVLPWRPLYELIQDFRSVAQDTTLRLSIEVLSGNWDALAAGRADLVIGADADGAPSGAFRSKDMGAISFVFCVAPQHPLAGLGRALSAQDIAAHCAVVVADTSRDLPPRTRGLQNQQAVIIMPTMQAKIDAQIRGLGSGYLPLPLAAPYLAQGLLVACPSDEGVPMTERLVYAWRAGADGQALKWWLAKLGTPALRQALLAAPAVI